MTSDRKTLIRLASGMPTGDPGRREILSALRGTAASKRYRIDKQTYVRNNGRHCPFCGYKDTEAVEADQDDMTKWTVMECPNCGAGWVDIFRLDSLDVESEPTVAPEDLKVPPKPGSPMHKEL
jgi:ribosomal protein S27AE